MAKATKKVSRDAYKDLKDIIIEIDTTDSNHWDTNRHEITQILIRAARDVVSSGMSKKEIKILEQISGLSLRDKHPQRDKVQSIDAKLG